MDIGIEKVATALPRYSIRQSQFANQFSHFLELNEKEHAWLQKLCDKCGIEKRYGVIPDFEGVQRVLFSDSKPASMAERHAIYAKEAPSLALEATRALGEDLHSITHIVGVTCTGVMAPGLETHIISTLGLDPAIERIGVNFMGCFGAFKGLAVAHSLVSENLDARVLVVCVELCSLHLHHGKSPNDLLANTLFADGAACALVSRNQSKWEVVRRRCMLLPGTADQMTWESDDHHFRMFLSPKVPKSIFRNIKPFVQKLLGDIPQEKCAFAIHPGGKAILEAIEHACKLKGEQTQASWEVLRNYGNMSSPTFLFVLDHLKSDYPYVVGLGFGPGLSIEGIILRDRNALV